MSGNLFKRVLITNDDGIDADGILALEQAVAEIADQVWVVAPDSDCSACSASLNLNGPIQTRQISERKFAIAGTPGDCVLMACRYFMLAKEPTLILSGINCGANLGDNLLFSGTVNAALIGAFLEIPSVAFSQAYRDKSILPWSNSRELVPKVLQRLANFAEIAWPAGVAFNVNFPDAPLEEIPELVPSRQGRGSILSVEVDAHADSQNQRQLSVSFAGKRQDLALDTDVSIVRRNAVSITPLRLDKTDHQLFEFMQIDWPNEAIHIL
jgi:5'-nucleotidase